MITKTFTYETKLSLCYYSSLPIFTENYESAKITTNNAKKKLLIKNFLLFTCLISNLTKQRFENHALKIKTSVLSNKTKIFTHLRAPFRHKLTKKHVYLNRYKLFLMLYIKTPKYIKITTFPTYESRQLINYFKTFETNMLTAHRFKIERVFTVKKNVFSLLTTI